MMFSKKRPKRKVKKNRTNNEKELTDYQKRLREFIVELQLLYKEGYSKSQIVKMLKTTYKRVRKYLHGDPDLLCKSDGRSTCNKESILDPYKTRIKRLLSEGNNYKEIFKKIKLDGYPGKYTILCDYCSSLVSYSSKAKLRKIQPKQYVNRSDIFKYLWSGNKEKINDDIFGKVVLKHPKVKEIQDCINNFREIFDKKNISLLNEFINKYKKSNIKSISGFAGGLTKDKKAVENSVTSQYSNGFVEGNNNRLKLIKRQMYGRAKWPLLKAKIIIKNDIFLPIINQD
ncbi:transposase [Acetivibrio saccincola]|nr:transposase [Acetivibrio saccincola]